MTILAPGGPLNKRPDDDPQNPALNTSAAGGTMGGTGGAPAGSTSPDKPSGSGQWTNLQRYLDVNKPQAGQMAGQIKEGYEQERQGLTADAQKLGQDYTDYIDPYRQTAEDKGQFIGKITTPYNTTPGTISGSGYGTLENPTSVSKNTSTGYVPTSSEMDKWGEGNLVKPTAPVNKFNTSDGYGDLQSDIDRFGQKVGATNTEAGRLTALRGIQGQGTSRGETLLNQLLMQGDPGARQMFAQQRQQFTDPSAGITGTMGQIGSNASAEYQALDDIRKSNEAQYGSAYGGIDTAKQNIAEGYESQQGLAGDVSDRYGQWNTNYDVNRNNMIQNELTDYTNTINNYSSEQLAQGLPFELKNQYPGRVVPDAIARQYYMNQFREKQASDAYKTQMSQQAQGYTDQNFGYRPDLINTGGWTEANRSPEEQARLDSLQSLFSGYSPQGV